MVQRDEVMPPTEPRPYWYCRAAEFAGDMLERLVPGDLAPRLVDRFAHHQVEDALPVGRVAPGEKRPFTGEWPRFALPSFHGTMRTTSSPFISALNEQPTPQ